MRVPLLMLTVLFAAVPLVLSQEGAGEKPPQSRAEPQSVGVLDEALPHYVPPEEEVSGKICVICSSVAERLLRNWAADFAAIYPEVQVEVDASERLEWIRYGLYSPEDEFGILQEAADTIFGSVDEGMGVKSWPVVVGGDKLEIIVHQNNPIEKLHVDELARIYSTQGKSLARLFEELREEERPKFPWDEEEEDAETKPPAENARDQAEVEVLDHPQIDHWNEFGIDPPWALAAAKIHLYGREYSADDSSFLEIRTVGYPTYMVGTTLHHPRMPRDDIRKVETAADMVEAVAKDPQGIGYVSRAMDLSGVRAVPVEGARRKGFFRRQQEVPHDPGQFESAALARPVVLWIARSDDAPRTKLQTEFLRYILSREGQSVVRNSRFAPLPATLAAEQLEAALKTPPPKPRRPEEGILGEPFPL